METCVKYIIVTFISLACMFAISSSFAQDESVDENIELFESEIFDAQEEAAFDTGQNGDGENQEDEDTEASSESSTEDLLQNDPSTLEDAEIVQPSDEEANEEEFQLFAEPMLEPQRVGDEPLPDVKREKEPVEKGLKLEPQYIIHPNAEKGLYKITKDKIYMYKVDRSDQNSAASFRFGLFEPTKLTNDVGESFSDLYPDASNIILLLDWERQFMQGSIGKLGWKLGSGVFFASGHGRFESDENAGLTPKESFTFFAFPLNAGLIYRMQFSDSQIFVPYIEGGLDLIGFSELRDDSQGPRFGGGAAGHASGGLSINLNFLDERTILELDKDYGINTLFLTAEFRTMIGFTEFDFSGNIINVGFLMEY